MMKSRFRYHVISCIVCASLFLPGKGSALPYEPVFSSVFAVEHCRAGVIHSFPDFTAPLRELAAIPHNAVFPSGKVTAPAGFEIISVAASSPPAKESNARLFDMLIPLFIGSILIGFSGIVRRIGTKPEPTGKFARMDVEAPYKKAVPS
jgi:hypothetical protein